MLLGGAVLTRTLLGRSLPSPSCSSSASRVRRRFWPFCCAVVGAASSAVAETSWAELMCFLARRPFSSSCADVRRRFPRRGEASGLLAESGGVGSQSAWCGLLGCSGAAGFPGPTLASMSLLALALALSSSEVMPQSASNASSSALRFSLSSVGVCPIAHSSAAP